MHNQETKILKSVFILTQKGTSSGGHGEGGYSYIDVSIKARAFKDRGSALQFIKDHGGEYKWYEVTEIQLR